MGYLLAYRHVEYRNEDWWQFAFHRDAPRAMRATVGTVVVIALISAWQLLRPQRRLPEPPSEEDWADVTRIVQASPATVSNLAFLGDKHFLFSDDRQAFVMFGHHGNCWISMGDPVGPKSSADDAAWSFMEACDAAGVRPVFYQTDESSLGRYVDMGLTMLKLGEEARVSLTDFSLEGSVRKDLRRTKKKSLEAGLTFEITHKRNVPDLISQLQQISDAWLGDKTTSEKGFSLGCFNPQYLVRFDLAVVRLQERLIAFANIWRGADHSELSVDLMRYLPDSPSGVMEFLFTELMLYGRSAGYRWFNLGMAPLSGIEPHRLGPLWNRASGLLFRHGEHFYNFRGLRNYKSKFGPEWFPKYLAVRGRLSVPRTLVSISTLISGGLAPLLRRSETAR